MGGYNREYEKNWYYRYYSYRVRSSYQHRAEYCLGGGSKNTQEIELKGEKFTRIDISGDNTTIEVVPTSSSNGKVEFKSKKSSRNKIKAYVDNDTLYVEMKKKRFQFFQIGFNSSNNKIVVMVPNNKYGELTTHTDNGQIIVNDLQVENVDIESNNGRIVLKNLESKKGQCTNG